MRWHTCPAESGSSTPVLLTEVAKLMLTDGHPDGFPLRMIGMREPRSENSWMHNASF